MKNNKKVKKEKRNTYSLRVKLTNSEKIKLFQIVKKLNTTLSLYVRKKIFS